MRTAVAAIAALWIAACSFDRGGTGAPGGDLPPPPDTEARLRISFDNAARGTITDFPMLVALDPEYFDYELAGDAGAGLTFRDADGATVLAHEVEQWVPGGRSLVWVRVPEIDGNSTTDHILLQYGGDAGAGQDAPALWAGFDAVYHLRDDPASTSIMPDSAADGRDANVIDGTGVAAVPGISGGALEFDGVNGYLEIRNGGAFDLEPGDAQTLEVSFRTGPREAERTLFIKEANCEGFAFVILSSGDLMGRFAATEDGCSDQQDSYVGTWGQSVADEQWHYAAFVIDRAAQQTLLYVDGELADDSQADNVLDGAGGTARVGASWDSTKKLAGGLDELRISAGVRPAAWISAQNAALRGQLAVYEPE